MASSASQLERRRVTPEQDGNMQMQSSPLQVTSACFFCLNCDHKQLFQLEYKRSNRTKGLKILRCFPHCCPEHIDRSYCGSSLSVSVRLTERSVATAPSEPAPHEVLSVFARFEAVSDVSLCVGECVEVDRMQRAVQTDTNLDGQWIAGVLDKPSEMVATIRAALGDSNSPLSGNSLVFHLNGKSVSRWYYDWESGANKAQRLMKHTLKAYIVERVAVDIDDNLTTTFSREAFTQLYRVLHVISSPEFTVVSYRRAPLEQLQTTHTHAAVQLAKTRILQHTRNASREDMSPDSLNSMQHRGGFPSIYNASGVSIARDHGAIETHLSRRSELGEVETKRRQQMYRNDQELIHSLDDRLVWEHSNSSAVAVSKNLALLFAFARWVPLRLYAPLVDELVHLVDQTILGPESISAKTPIRPNCFSRLLHQHAQIEKSIQLTGGSTTLSLELETLLRVTSQTVLWLFSRETCSWMHVFFHQNATSVLDKEALRSCFLHFLRELEERLNTEVLAATSLHKLSNVAEEVIAAVYSFECFYDRRPLVRQILSGQSFAGWNMFVAHARDTFIGAKIPPVPLLSLDRSATFTTAFPPRNAIERSWHGEWLLDVDDVLWDINEISPDVDDKGTTITRVPDVSLFSLVALISQIVRFEIAIDIEMSTFRVRAPQGLAGGVDCMQLVLDGKKRVFRIFPNGITSFGSNGTCGDYVGEMRVESPGQLVLFLEIYNWSLEHGTPSYHVRATIECHSDDQLSVDGDILETRGSSTFTADEVPYVGEMSLRAKLEAVEKANARRYPATAESRNAPVSSWVEYGKFHSGYRKISDK